MKRLISCLVLFITAIIFVACDKENEDEQSQIFTPQGEVIFYTVEDGACGNIEVYIEGVYLGVITSYITNGVTPNCGNDGFATGSVDVGEDRNFTATCGLYTWDGTITINANECSTMQLNF